MAVVGALLLATPQYLQHNRSTVGFTFWGEHFPFVSRWPPAFCSVFL